MMDFGKHLETRLEHWRAKYKTDMEIKADPYHSVGVIKELEKLYKTYKGESYVRNRTECTVRS